VARMQPMQIHMEPSLPEALDRLAQKRGTSRSGLIRIAARIFVEQEAERYGSIVDQPDTDRGDEIGAAQPIEL
jgi:metal-responsive CopG/Arc/MetJ family transcriptional regulator